jgi:hypothetical protein
MRTREEARLFNAYRNFNQVANNPNNPMHQRLAEQGIQVENRFASFKEFHQWVEDNLGPRPGPDYRIIRKNQLKDYSPKNLTWGLSEDVALELYRDKKIRFKGRSLNACQWAKELNINSSMIYSRIALGLTKAKDLLAPAKKVRKKNVR